MRKHALVGMMLGTVGLMALSATDLAAADPSTIACSASALTQAFATGGSFVYAADCQSLNAGPYTLAAGVSLSLDAGGHQVSIQGPDRLATIDGSLALTGITVQQTTHRGTHGPDGVDGAAGADGSGSGAGGNGQPGTDAGSGGIAQGGALFIDPSGAVTLNGVTFSGNRAIGGTGGRPGGGGRGGNGGGGDTAGGPGGNGGNAGRNGDGANGEGGAIYNEGTLTITGSTFTMNEADGSNGGIQFGGNGGNGGNGVSVGGKGGNGGTGSPAGRAGDAYGGAIYNTGTLAVSDTSFTKDVASTGSTTGQGGGGGGHGGNGHDAGGGGGDGGNGGTVGPPATATGGAVYSTTPWTFSGGSTSANKVVAGDVHLNAVSSSGDGGPGGAAGVDNGGHSGSAGQPGQPPHGSEQYVAGFTSYPDFSIAPNSSKLHVDLAAFTPGGEKLNGQVASGDVVVVRLTVSNDGDTDLHNLQLAGGAPLVIDPRGTGTLTLLLGPTPSFDASTLPAHTAREYIYALTASVSGRAAAETKVSVDDAGLGHLEAARSLRFDIAPADVVNPFDQALTKFLAINAVDRSLVSSFRSYSDQLSAKAAQLAAKLRRGFSSADRKRWFGGDGSKVSVGPLDDARARQEASSGPMMATQFPKGGFHGYTADELQAEYDKTFKEETGKGVDRWVKGWKDLGQTVQHGLQTAWSNAVLGTRYVWGTATPEERLQMEAIDTANREGITSRLHSIYDTALREIPRTIDNFGYLMDAADTSYDQIVAFPVYVVQSFYQRQTELLPLADSDPLKYQRESAKLAADAVNQGLPVIFDTLIAGGATKLAVGGKAYLIAGKGAAIVETAEALGTLTDTGKLVKGATSSLLLDNSLLPAGLAAEESAALEAEGKFLARNAHATVVQSSDAGNVYSLPNLGGVPETTLDAKAAILGDLEKDYAAKTGKTIELAEVLKPGTPLAKAGGVAKVELTAPKTGKPVMVDAGMPEAALGEAQVWHNPVSPAKGNPDFANWAKPRQEEALQAWKDGNARFAEWVKPDPGSKDALMQQCIGKVGRVPLDPQPVNGLQRFAVAEFEEKTVKQGTGKAVLLRVKKYAVEVVDTERGVVVNRRTVVDSKTALPQTPDADSVAVGKVVGRDASGQPIIAPLDRAEREFIMPRYVDKNVKARRSGAVPDLAEHGTTLVMDDAGAKAAGSLLPKYGVPFLPEAVGRAYLARIAKFVAPGGVSADAMLTKMLTAVEASGGFGQHTVVVTSDSRFLGEVQFASW